jgi:hypothetical protein
VVAHLVSCAVSMYAFALRPFLVEVRLYVSLTLCLLVNRQSKSIQVLEYNETKKDPIHRSNRINCGRVGAPVPVDDCIQ